MSANDENSVADEIRRLATQEEEPFFYGPVSEDAVEEAERELGLRFPRSFHLFLRHFGAALMLRHSFAGLPDTRDTGDEMPLFPHVVDNSRANWHDSRGEELAPSHFIYVTSDGGSYRFFLDTSKMDSRNECPVVVWGPGADGIVVADSFLEFLRKLDAKVKLF